VLVDFVGDPADLNVPLFPGSNAAHVEIVIPQIIIEDYEGQSMSWDAERWNIIESKRTLAECACDDVIPNMTSLNRQEFLARAVDDLNALKVAITEGEAKSKGVGN
jgi:hypothetical protein